MGHYVVRRLLQAIPLMFIISIVLFGLVNLAPGGPLAGRGAKRLKPEQIAILKRQFGLDKPICTQYVYWLIGNDWTIQAKTIPEVKSGFINTLKQCFDYHYYLYSVSPGQGKGVLRGDFGDSYKTRQPVLKEITAAFKNSAYLMSITLVVVAIIAIPVGVISAVKQYSIFDIIVTTLSFIGQAIPEFWLGLILILLFYVWLKIRSLVILCYHLAV